MLVRQKCWRHKPWKCCEINVIPDILWTGITIAFFAIAIVYVPSCDRIPLRRNAMSAGSIILLLVSGWRVYLLYASSRGTA